MNNITFLVAIAGGWILRKGFVCLGSCIRNGVGTRGLLRLTLAGLVFLRLFYVLLNPIPSQSILENHERRSIRQILVADLNERRQSFGFLDLLYGLVILALLQLFS